MIHVNIDEMQQNLPIYIKRAESGESFVITRDGKPVFEIKPIKKQSTGKRPSGLCKGEFHVPDDFDAPLPEEILRDFEG